MASQVIEQTIAAGIARTSAVETGELLAPLDPNVQSDKEKLGDGKEVKGEGEKSGSDDSTLKAAVEQAHLRGRKEGKAEEKSREKTNFRRRLLSYMGLGGDGGRSLDQSLMIPDAVPPVGCPSPHGATWRFF
eukprot:TRINITY_DN2065_c1_g3_i1.p1 TRINITY_DN2065_c1_g3~~TRINITY_DN2065_c1_g3_i1.p1  ORF type:complete len:144 (+),score=19.95 TRINITY_DN2065_c1_g3_i1:39-434(+)